MGTNESVKDLIMWVGAKPYKTWLSFATEARVRGVCKRVLKAPRNITLGESRCYLIHGERVLSKVPVRVHSFQKKDGQCRYCGLSRNTVSEIPIECGEHMARRCTKSRRFIYGYFVIEKVMIADDEDADKVLDRMCGRLKEGGTYLLGPLTEYPTPKPYTGPSYVGFRYTERVTLGD